MATPPPLTQEELNRRRAQKAMTPLGAEAAGAEQDQSKMMGTPTQKAAATKRQSLAFKQLQEAAQECPRFTRSNGCHRTECRRNDSEPRDECRGTSRRCF